MKVLELVSVSKTYINGDTYLKALNNVSMSIKQEEFIAVIGTSGSGKSTLLNMIGGLEYPTERQVLINGVNIVELSEEERTRFRLNNIGFVFQNYNLVPVINVFENIILPVKLMGRQVDEKGVIRLAEELGIANKLQQFPGALSGGQQQRAAIARALYTKPALLLADVNWSRGYGCVSGV